MKTTVGYLNTIRYLISVSITAFAFLTIQTRAFSQALVLDPGFNVQAGLNDVVWTSQIQSDGKIIVGGDFTTYNSSPASRIVRINPNGTIDNTFIIGQGFNGTVWALAIQSDGKILVGGQFSSYNGMQYNRLIRLNPNGTPDSNFNPSLVVDGIVRSIHVMPDNKILVGGYLSNKIVKLNPNGTQDLGFVFSPQNLTSIVTIALQNDGKILVGGESFNKIYRLHPGGNIDFSYNPTFNGTVRTISLQPDGKAIVGGDFTFFSNSGFLTRLNVNGTIDNTFNIGSGANENIWKTHVLNNGSILAGGKFTSFNGVNSNRYLIVLNSNGTINSQYNFGSGFSFGSSIGAVLSTNVQSDGKILAFGQFSTYNSSPSMRIARLSNPCPPPTLHNGLSSTTICSGTTNLFSVSASGSGLSYQWFFNDSIISGAVNNFFVASSSGTYTVRVTNSCGAMISSSGTLNVRQSLITPTQPSCALNAVKICATSSGERTINLIWQPGSGNKQLVVLSTSPIGDLPNSGALYSANTIFGMGDDLGNNTYAVFNGTGNSVTVTNAPSNSSRVFFAVFDYNDQCGPPMYLVNSFATGVIRAKDSVALCNNIVDLTKSGGINSANGDVFRIYPNPAKDSFTIQTSGLSAEEIIHYRVITSTGVVEASGQLIGSDQKIDFSGKSSGVYFIQLSTSQNSTVRKIIID